jgi:hypothetical protein
MIEKEIKKLFLSREVMIVGMSLFQSFETFQKLIDLESV